MYPQSSLYRLNELNPEAQSRVSDARQRLAGATANMTKHDTVTKETVEGPGKTFGGALSNGVSGIVSGLGLAKQLGLGAGLATAGTIATAASLGGSALGSYGVLATTTGMAGGAALPGAASAGLFGIPGIGWALGAASIAAYMFS